MKNKFDEIRERANEMGIEIKIAEMKDASAQGIHRLYPNMNDICDAVEQAERDGFTTIFIHNSITWKK